MTAERRITLLSSIALGLAVIYAVGLILNRPPAVPVVVPQFREALADRIVAGGVDLRKTSEGAWQVAIGSGWYPADSARIDRLLSSVSGLIATRVASRSKKDWATFHVDSAGASRLDVSSGNRPLAALYIGAGSSGGGVYVRSAGRPDVYDVAGSILDYVSGSSSYWSYLRIMPKALSIDSLETIAISAHGFSVGGEAVDGSYLLESSAVAGSSSWIVNGHPGEKLSQQKILSLEGEIVGMAGDRFVDGIDTKAAGLTAPVAVITVTDQQGGSWSILVGKHAGSQFYVMRKGSPYIYLVNQWTLHRAVPPLSALLATGSAAGG